MWARRSHADYVSVHTKQIDKICGSPKTLCVLCGLCANWLLRPEEQPHPGAGPGRRLFRALDAQRSLASHTLHATGPYPQNRTSPRTCSGVRLFLDACGADQVSRKGAKGVKARRGVRGTLQSLIWLRSGLMQSVAESGSPLRLILFAPLREPLFVGCRAMQRRGCRRLGLLLFLSFGRLRTSAEWGAGLELSCAPPPQASRISFSTPFARLRNRSASDTEMS